jgi:hypothetical protein
VVTHSEKYKETNFPILGPIKEIKEKAFFDMASHDWRLALDYDPKDLGGYRMIEFQVLEVDSKRLQKIAKAAAKAASKAAGTKLVSSAVRSLLTRQVLISHCFWQDRFIFVDYEIKNDKCSVIINSIE